jgi:hypothetical protein
MPITAPAESSNPLLIAGGEFTGDIAAELKNRLEFLLHPTAASPTLYRVSVA